MSLKDYGWTSFFVEHFSPYARRGLEAGRVVAVDDIIVRVWGAEFMGEPQAVYVHIRWLREKIEADPNKPERIVNVRGVGYKLVPQPG